MPAGADGVIEVFRDMRRQLKPEQGKTRETVLQAIVIGDVAIVGVPAEYFTIFGVDIKRRSPFREHRTSPSWPTTGSAICRISKLTSWAAIRPGWACTATPSPAPANGWPTQLVEDARRVGQASDAMRTIASNLVSPERYRCCRG